MSTLRRGPWPSWAARRARVPECSQLRSAVPIRWHRPRTHRRSSAYSRQSRSSQLLMMGPMLTPTTVGSIDTDGSRRLDHLGDCWFWRFEGQRNLTSRPVAARVTNAVRWSGPPKQMLVGIASGMSTSHIDPSGEIAASAPEPGSATTIRPSESTASESSAMLPGKRAITVPECWRGDCPRFSRSQHQILPVGVSDTYRNCPSGERPMPLAPRVRKRLC